MIFPENIIDIRKQKKQKNVFDLSIKKTDELNQYSSIELHFILYPYSRNINSSDIHFHPFEEYVADVNSNQHSAYIKINKRFNELFGFLLGSFIALIFYKFKPEDLFSVESIVAVFAAYSIGKELWSDFVKMLVYLTKNFRLRFIEDYYKYELDENTTMTHYSNLAKKERYKKNSILPRRLHFLELSNSQTVRMYFKKNDFSILKDESAHIFSIHINENKIKDFKKKGYLLGIKMSLNKKILGFTSNLELFQSIHNHKKGCLDESQTWYENQIFYRNAISLMRMKLFLKRGLLKDKTIFTTE